VVAQVKGMTDRGGPVWIPFDFEPANEDGERTHCDEDGWEQLRRFDEKMTMVKIADSIDELEHGRGTRVADGTASASSSELVGTVRTSHQNSIIRRELCVDNSIES
jgi:hypothetical protein